MFSDVLLTVDYDRTLTAPDSTIPQRNLEAIRYFIANGGAFTVNTGRSIPLARGIMKNVPLSAPLLLYNGSAAYNVEKQELYSMRPIELDPQETIARALELFPDLVVEVQAMDAHSAFRKNENWEAFGEHNHCPWKYITPDRSPTPFLKFSLYLTASTPTVNAMFSASPQDSARMDEAEAVLHREFGDALEVFRAAPKIIDIHARGVSKICSARDLQKSMGRKILVCAGDALNDLSMLEGAD